MTPRQKRIVTILAIADIAVILVLALSIMHPSGVDSLLLSRRHTPPPPYQICQWEATQLLARAGLGGTVTLARNGPLHFEITYPLATGEATDEAAQAAAQLVWTAFDIALALQEQEGKCAIFNQVEVEILAHNDRLDTQINASVSTQDLVAFGAGELIENEFIKRVTYTTSVSHAP